VDSTHSNLRPATGLARWIKEPYCGLSHAFGAVAMLIGVSTLMLLTPGGVERYIGLAVYGLAGVLLFSASAAAHSLHVSPRVEALLDRLDHAAIFALIAGTYTPICLTVLHGPWGNTMLAIEWTIAAVGASLVLFSRVPLTWVAPLYVPMGWLVVVATGPLLRLATTAMIAWLLIGGVVFTLGAVVFITKRPRLWPGRFGFHDLWHTMVLIGVGCHFIAISQVTL